eukprot:171210-Chlamydomonas_euryale.AAC.1
MDAFRLGPVARSAVRPSAAPFTLHTSHLPAGADDNEHADRGRRHGGKDGGVRPPAQLPRRDEGAWKGVHGRGAKGRCGMGVAGFRGRGSVVHPPALCPVGGNHLLNFHIERGVGGGWKTAQEHDVEHMVKKDAQKASPRHSKCENAFMGMGSAPESPPSPPSPLPTPPSLD